MTAQLKVYTDNAHASEVAHASNVATTLNNGGTLATGATALTLLSTTGMPAQGYVDIDTAGNLETIPYTGITGLVVTLAYATAISHANSVAVVQWYYSLPIGDQVNGIPNDGTNAAPNGATNVGTWYCYNAGNQVAQSPVLSTSAAAPSTASGFADTLISTTSISAGFAASVSPANLAVGAQVQFWVVAQVPTGQSPAGNPQACVINMAYSTI